MENIYAYNRFRSIPALLVLALTTGIVFRKAVPLHYIILICSLIFMATGRVNVLIDHGSSFLIKTSLLADPKKIELSMIQSIDIGSNKIIIKLNNETSITFPLVICEPEQHENIKRFFSNIELSK